MFPDEHEPTGILTPGPRDQSQVKPEVILRLAPLTARFLLARLPNAGDASVAMSFRYPSQWRDRPRVSRDSQTPIQVLDSLRKDRDSPNMRGCGQESKGIHPGLTHQPVR